MTSNSFLFSWSILCQHKKFSSLCYLKAHFRNQNTNLLWLTISVNRLWWFIIFGSDLPIKMDLNDFNKVLEIKTLRKFRESEAREILQKIAKQVQPIMCKHKWKIGILSEFWYWLLHYSLHFFIFFPMTCQYAYQQSHLQPWKSLSVRAEHRRRLRG